jgi:hypothetical protein
MPPGSTIEVDTAPEEDERDVVISIIKPKVREAVGVGAKGGAIEEGSDQPEPPSDAAELPDEPEVLPDVPDAPPAEEE